MSSDYVIEARLSSDDCNGEEEEEQTAGETESETECAAVKGNSLTVDSLDLKDTETAPLL